MAIDKIQSESINLADNFAFTGTITGVGGIGIIHNYLSSGNTSIPDSTHTVLTNSFSADATLGSAMSVSSGVWTFPENGYYLVNWTANASLYPGTNVDVTMLQSGVDYSTDSGSNWTGKAIHSQTSIIGKRDGSHTFNASNFVVDVTNASTFRLRFKVYKEDNTTNNMDMNNIVVAFTKLADT